MISHSLKLWSVVSTITSTLECDLQGVASALGLQPNSICLLQNYECPDRMIGGVSGLTGQLMSSIGRNAGCWLSGPFLDLVRPNSRGRSVSLRRRAASICQYAAIMSHTQFSTTFRCAIGDHSDRSAADRSASADVPSLAKPRRSSSTDPHFASDSPVVTNEGADRMICRQGANVRFDLSNLIVDVM